MRPTVDAGTADSFGDSRHVGRSRESETNRPGLPIGSLEAPDGGCAARLSAGLPGQRLAGIGTLFNQWDELRSDDAPQATEVQCPISAHYWFGMPGSSPAIPPIQGKRWEPSSRQPNCGCAKWTAHTRVTRLSRATTGHRSRFSRLGLIWRLGKCSGKTFQSSGLVILNGVTAPEPSLTDTQQARPSRPQP